MLHVKRCGNQCRNLVTGPKYPAGACGYNGVIVAPKPEIRQWIYLRGCCAYRAPISDIIDAADWPDGKRSKSDIIEGS